MTRLPLWRLEGYDTFAGEEYPLGVHTTDDYRPYYLSRNAAVEAAKTRLWELGRIQPHAGGQGPKGIQDHVYIVHPDGRKERVTEDTERGPFDTDGFLAGIRGRADSAHIGNALGRESIDLPVLKALDPEPWVIGSWTELLDFRTIGAGRIRSLVAAARERGTELEWFAGFDRWMEQEPADRKDPRNRGSSASDSGGINDLYR